MSLRSDVVVLGGGIVGLSVAWRCIEQGMAVTLVDPVLPGGASPAAAGMLAPITEAHFGESSLLALNLKAAESYPTFVEALADRAGIDVSYRRTGTVSVARDRDEYSELARTFDFLARSSLDATLLNADEVRSLEPQLAPWVQGGIHVADDHQVDNRALLSALRAAAGSATLIEQQAVAVLQDDDGVRGVRLADGREVPATSVVIAMGAWAGRLELPADEPLPIRPVKGQLLHLRSPRAMPQATHNIRGLEAYIVARPDGRLVVGATVEEQGFDTRATAGAAYALLRAAVEILPGITECELVEISTGLRPGTPDNAPLIGRLDLPGLFVATGHYRNGILLAFITGQAIADAIATGVVPDIVAPFAPTRFRHADEVSKR